MKHPKYKHEDDRRKIIEYISDFPIRTSKVIFVKSEDALGNHYHKLKDDIFYLVKGSGTYTLDGVTEPFNEEDCLFVGRGVVHSFNLNCGSILIESSTLPYDKGDEYEV